MKMIQTTKEKIIDPDEFLKFLNQKGYLDWVEQKGNDVEIVLESKGDVQVNEDGSLTLTNVQPLDEDSQIDFETLVNEFLSQLNK